MGKTEGKTDEQLVVDAIPTDDNGLKTFLGTDAGKAALARVLAELKQAAAQATMGQAPSEVRPVPKSIDFMDKNIGILDHEAFETDWRRALSKALRMLERHTDVSTDVWGRLMASDPNERVAATRVVSLIKILANPVATVSDLSKAVPLRGLESHVVAGLAYLLESIHYKLLVVGIYLIPLPNGEALKIVVYPKGGATANRIEVSVLAGETTFANVIGDDHDLPIIVIAYRQ